MKRMVFIILPLILIAGLVFWKFSGRQVSGRSADQVQANAGEQHQLWTCGMHPEVLQSEPGNCPICGMKLVPVRAELGGAMFAQQSAADDPPQNTQDQQQPAENKKERKILYWRAPMDPTEIYDHPGKSRMGMDLIPVYEDEAALGKGGTIVIDPVIVQDMGVRTTQVKRMDFYRLVRTVGKIEYAEDRLYAISPKISGWIDRLYLTYTGQMVRKGERILEIYSPELVTTQQEYLLALNTHAMLTGSEIPSVREGAESLLESTRNRLLYWDIPPSEIERLEKTRQVKRTVSLLSPVNGMVVELNVHQGDYVKEGKKIFQIADLSHVWVHASIYDYEVPWIYEGQPAEMELSYLPGKTFHGRVSYVYPFLREKARDVHVRLEFDNPNLELKPGMFVNVQLHGKPIPNALVIPLEAVIRTGERNIVFVVREPGKFEPREVRLGEEGGPGNNFVRVISGLLEGETVVTSAQFLLDSESRLQEAIQKMLEERRGKPEQKPGEPQHVH
ncbi:MAG: efflux RND transporter periplasmic adaptor subunit [Calditrichaeota bacterium]|nr:MAG: efflux RND transporter periplasmic adaptor subunit [Calditrichota bacterium]